MVIVQWLFYASFSQQLICKRSFFASILVKVHTQIHSRFILYEMYP